MASHVTVRLSLNELDLLKEALDSHIYWQLSDERYRNNGFVHGEGSDDPEARALIQESEHLFNRLERVAASKKAEKLHRLRASAPRNG